MSKKTCYYCNKIATTKEHVPAKSFFDTCTKLPTNLIKVPSCVEHNNIKSKTDFIIGTLFSLTRNVEKFNSIDKLKIRSLALKERYLNRDGTIELPSETRHTLITYMEQMCCGLYYKKHNFSKKLLNLYPYYSMCYILQINNDQDNMDNRLKYMIYMESTIQQLFERNDFDKLKANYNNGQFWFKVLETDKDCLFEISFYDNVKLYVGFARKQTLPRFLTNLFM